MLDKLVAKKTLVICCLLALFALQSFAAIRSKSATFDEVQYLGIGKYLLTQHKWDIMGAILHPPLSFYLNSLPLLMVQEDKKLWNYDVKEKDLFFLGSVDYYRGQELLSAPFNADDRLLIASRTLTLLLAFLLGWYVYRFSSDLYGEKCGLFSLLLFSFCPNMLAYSGLIVPDFHLTVFSFIFVYYLWQSLRQPLLSNRLLAGLCLGAATLCKFTAFLLLPVAVLAAVIWFIKYRGPVVTTVLAVFGIAAVILLAGYQFNPAPLLQGIQYQLMHASGGHASYLMGEWSSQGWWYYYLAAFLLKTPIPLLILFTISVFFVGKRLLNGKVDESLLLLPVMMIGAFFSLNHQSIGLRYILPVYPFLFVCAGSFILLGRRQVYVAALLALWLVVGTMMVGPHYLAYFNEAAGGPANGYRFLADSNLDWGQDLKGLKQYMERNGVEKISLSYFGADDARRYGINYDWLPSHYLYNNEPEKPYDISPNQLVAVSVTNLLGLYLEDRSLYKGLLQYEPVAKVGYSIYVYNLRGSGTSFRK